MYCILVLHRNCLQKLVDERRICKYAAIDNLFQPFSFVWMNGWVTNIKEKEKLAGLFQQNEGCAVTAALLPALAASASAVPALLMSLYVCTRSLFTLQQSGFKSTFFNCTKKKKSENSSHFCTAVCFQLPAHLLGFWPK